VHACVTITTLFNSRHHSAYHYNQAMRRRAGLYGLIQSLIERLIEHQLVDALLTAQMHGNQKLEYWID